MFGRLRRKIQRLKTDEAMMRAVEGAAEKIEAMNRDRLWQSKRKSGTTIAPSYAPSTLKVKRRKGQPTRVTLKDTGEFYDSIRVKADRKGASVGSEHTVGGFDLAGHLADRYGEIYGIPKTELLKLIKPGFIDEYKRLVTGN